MDKLKSCLIERNKIPFKELWQEASCFADDIVCAVGTDFMTKIAEAERKFICDLLNSLQQMEVVDAVPVVRCKDCIRRYDTDECPMCFLIEGKYYEYTNENGFCDRGERKEGVEMTEYFAGGHLRFVNGEWRDDNGNAIEISRVRHGQWVDNGIPDSILSGCSVCGFTCGSSSFFYCPNCGAKMDGCDGNIAICSKTT